MATTSDIRRAVWQVRNGTADISRRRSPPTLCSVDARPDKVTFDLNRTAVVVIDMQNDFCSPGGWLSHAGIDVSPLQAPIAPIQEFLGRARSAGMPVLFVNWGNRPDRANLPPQILYVYDHDGTGTGIGESLPGGSRVLEKGSWSASLVAGITTDPGDIMIDKYRMTGFVDTELDGILRTLDVSTVLFCGVNLDQCVFATLIDASSRGYDCILLEDCCATTSPPECITATLYNVAQCFGFVSSSAALIEGLDRAVTAVTATISSPELHEPRRQPAHRIAAGDTVKLVVLRRPSGPHDSSVFLEIWDPGGSQPSNSHADSVETFYVLHGHGVAHCDNTALELSAHQFLVLPAGSVHRIENTGSDRLYAITTMAPDHGFCSLVEKGPAEPLDAVDERFLSPQT